MDIHLRSITVLFTNNCSQSLFFGHSWLCVHLQLYSDKSTQHQISLRRLLCHMLCRKSLMCHIIQNIFIIECHLFGIFPITIDIIDNAILIGNHMHDYLLQGVSSECDGTKGHCQTEYDDEYMTIGIKSKILIN